MHGAAHTANAPPSSAPEPRRRAPVEQPRRDDPLRHRQQPDEREAEHDEHEAGDLASARSARQHAADRRRAGAEHDEDDREAEDERDARDDDAPRRAALAEPSRLDARERREVARHERQHARRDHRREAGEERDRRAARPSLAASRAARRAGARSPGRARRRPVGGSPGSRARASGSSARRRTRAAPAPSDHAAERQPPREQVEALVRRRREDAGAEVRDELRLDLALRSRTASIRVWMKRLDPLRRRRVRLVERRVAGRAHDLALEVRATCAAARRRPRQARRARAPRRRRPRAREDHESSAASTPRRNASAWFGDRCRRCARRRDGLCRSMKYVSGTPVIP